MWVRATRKPISQPNRARSSTLGESVKPRRICDQNLFPDSRIWRPERQQVEQPAVVDLEKWRHIGRFFSRRRDRVGMRPVGPPNDEPTKSENITGDLAALGGVLRLRLDHGVDLRCGRGSASKLADCAAESCRRSPRTTPISFEVLISQVAKDREINAIFGKTSAYSDMPSFSSQSAICCIAAPASSSPCRFIVARPSFWTSAPKRLPDNSPRSTPID